MTAPGGKNPPPESASRGMAYSAFGSTKLNKPEEVLTFSLRLALKAKGGAPRLFLPANLETFLNTANPVKPLRVEVYGTKK